MARNTVANKNSGSFMTNDWRNLTANTAETYLNSVDDMFDDKNGLTDVGIANLRVLAQDVALLKQDSHQIKTIVYDLQNDRDNLRTAIRKLKVENVRIKAKLKRLSDAVKTHGAMGDTMDIEHNDEEVEYEDLRQFLLVGGPKDPFALQFNDATIQDTNDVARVTHKTCERFYWYKMAQFFEDKEAMEKILNAEDARKAEEILKDVKNFDQAKWDAVKVKFWEDAQRLKFDQHRWIRNLLIKTTPTYIAVASQDKTLGTGWRKQREEASRTQLWDGENMGGKILMKLREELSANHSWTSEQEEKDALSKFNEFKRSIWKPYGAALRKPMSLAAGGLRRGVERLTVGGGAPAPLFPPPQLAAGRLAASKVAAKKRRQI